MFWCEEHIQVSNQLTRNYTSEYMQFEKLIKSIYFASHQVAYQFIAYFIHDFFIFFTGDRKNCYFKFEPTKDHPDPIARVSMDTFKSITINGKGIGKLDSVLTKFPFHKFLYADYNWGIDSSDIRSFSMAYLFNFNKVEKHITEADIPDDLMFYFKAVLCSADEESWVWLRAFLANMIHQPNAKTGVMLIL